VTVLLANAPTRIPLGGGRERFFVKAGSRWPFSIEKAEREPCRYVPFPFGLATLGALLEQHGIPVEAFDAVALNADRETFLARATAYRPSIIVMETTTPTIDADLQVCAELKRATSAVIALAGAHVTVYGDKILAEHVAVDWVLTGEYELAALEAIQAQRAGRSLGEVGGLLFAADDNPRVVVSGPKGEPIHDLNRLPMPARHLFPTRQAPTLWPYWDGFCQHRPAAQLHSSRGCPFRCTFCSWTSVIYGHGKFRSFPARRVVDEMESVVALGAREIYFDDDIFTGSEQHVLAITDEILARGLRVPWSVMGDAIIANERMIDAMARAGCIGMKLGVESADPQVLRRARKPIKIDRVRQVVGWCAARGMKTHATFTFGLEGETPETMAASLRFACELPVDSIQFSVHTPFPGTESFARAQAAGRVDTSCWSRFDGARSSVLRFEGLSAEQVARFAERAPAVWLRARLRDPTWIRRQARYFATTLGEQGIVGLLRRADRGVRLLFDRPR